MLHAPNTDPNLNCYPLTPHPYHCQISQTLVHHLNLLPQTLSKARREKPFVLTCVSWCGCRTRTWPRGSSCCWWSHRSSGARRTGVSGVGVEGSRRWFLLPLPPASRSWCSPWNRPTPAVMMAPSFYKSADYLIQPTSLTAITRGLKLCGNPSKL